MKKFILISMVLLCLILIFYFSSENNYESMDTTIKVSRVINVEEGNLSILRKYGHFIEFFVLEILLLSMFSCFIKVDFKIYIISLIFCLLYAFSDEIHQLYVIGRSAQVMDVCIDFCGSIIGSILFIMVYYIYNEGFVKWFVCLFIVA